MESGQWVGGLLPPQLWTVGKQSMGKYLITNIKSVAKRFEASQDPQCACSVF
jgi:hypothetical protein